VGHELEKDLGTLLKPIAPWYYQPAGTYSDDFLFWMLNQK